MAAKNCGCKLEVDPWNLKPIQTRNNVCREETLLKPYPVQQLYEFKVISQPGSVPSLPGSRSPTDNFHEAVSSLNVDQLQGLIHKDPTLVNQRGFNGQLPLHRACLHGDTAVVLMLIRNKADPNGVNDFNETPIHYACKRANLIVIHHLILVGARLDAEDKSGKGVLHHAAHGGSVMMCHYLLDSCQLNPHVRDRNLSTPMHIICMHGHIEAFEYFIKKERCDPFSKDAQGNTLLHVAAGHGSLRMSWQLLQLGGYKLLNEVNVDGYTALDLSKQGTQPKYTDIVRLLSYYSFRRRHKSGLIDGPVLAWYGLLFLPWFIFLVTYLLTFCFVNKGPIVLFGVIFMMYLRIFHLHRMNHVSRWPSPAHVGIFVAGMFWTFSSFCLQLMPYIYYDHTYFIVVSLFLSFVTFYTYYILMTRDPGVVKSSCEKSETGSFYTITDVATGHLTVDRFCTKCELVPPLMSSHCKLCDKCYVKVDHHCLYLYRCVAVDNHRLFVFFNVVVVMVMAMFETACVLYINSVFPTHQLDWSLASTVFSSYPSVWSLFFLNGVAIVWAVWLIQVQLKVIMKGRILAYQPYHTPSHLNSVQRLFNVIYFVLNREPYAVDNNVCSA